MKYNDVHSFIFFNDSYNKTYEKIDKILDLNGDNGLILILCY